MKRKRKRNLYHLWFCFAMLLFLAVPFKVKAETATTPVSISVQYGQTEARTILNMINENAYKQHSAWYWRDHQICRLAFFGKNTYCKGPTIASTEMLNLKSCVGSATSLSLLGGQQRKVYHPCVQTFTSQKLFSYYSSHISKINLYI
ncbi:MAG: hypothetical protein V8Q93_09050 [Blautia faecis]